MARTSTMNVSLTPTLDRYVRAKVASGKYESASEVIRESLRLSQAAELGQRAFWAGVKGDVQVARQQIADGLVKDGEAVMDEIAAEFSVQSSPRKPKKSRR